jgi:small-conductance mechanosensitive channel
LGNGVLSGAYSGVILYAAVHVAEPLVGGLLRTPLARSMRVFDHRRQRVGRQIVRGIAAAAALWWVAHVLAAFGAADVVGDALGRAVQAPIQLGQFAFSLGDVLLFVGTIAAAWLVSRLIRVLLEEDVFPRTRLTRGVPHAISATVRYAILVAGFLLAAAAAGFEWNRITLLAGAFGVGIGFGLQNIVNNFISGLILLYERPIQIGDTVEVGQLTGEVKRIGIRSSTLRTFQGAEVIVPNANLIQEQVVNWTLSDRQRRIELAVGVAYGTPPERVIDLLLEVARANPEVNAEPEPLALFRGFGDNALNFELRAWAGFENYLSVQSKLAIAVNEALQKNGIPIPFPQRDVRLIVDDKRKNN